jgi:hypothetical protein
VIEPFKGRIARLDGPHWYIVEAIDDVPRHLKETALRAWQIKGSSDIGTVGTMTYRTDHRSGLWYFEESIAP